MKNLLIVLLTALSMNTFAQSYELKNDTLHLPKGGYLVKEGEVTFGKGTKDNGYFRYIEVNAASMMRAYNTSGTNYGVQDANAMSSQYNDLKGKIIRFEERGNKRTGFKWYAIVGVGEARRYQIDIENALTSGEIVIPGVNYSNKSDAVAPKTTSVADELLKLKSLLDQGLITEDEFAKMKADLLK